MDSPGEMQFLQDGDTIEANANSKDSGFLFDADNADQARRLIYSLAPEYDNYPYTSDIPTVKGTDGRSSKVSPWQFKDNTMNAAEHEVGVVTGVWQRYDPSGYNLDYDLQYSNLTALSTAYQTDMLQLRERGWFTNRTRAIIVSFTLFNSNYDMWAQSDFILEMPVSSIVVPIKHVNVFSPSMKDVSHSTVIFWLDNIRLLFALFILILQVWSERSMAKRDEEQWCFSYLLTPLGLADLAIAFLTIWIYVIRELILGFVEKPETFLDNIMYNEQGFQSSDTRAWLYRQQIQCEAPLFCLLLFRLLSFLRINRQVYIIWTTIVEAGKLYLPFCLCLMPVGFGLVIWAHGLWHNTLREFTSLHSSAMSVIMMIHGDINLKGMFSPHRPDTLIFGTLLYVVTWLLLINAWVAVLVNVYQNVRVRAGYRAADYKWKEKHYVVWALWRRFAAFYFKFLRPRIDKPKAYQNVDDDDDDK